jgi:hypothetical protein
MARAKTSKAKPPEPAAIPPPEPTNQSFANENILTIRGKPAWKDWLERYAAHRRVKPTVMIELALFESAARDKFEPPPPRL